MDIKLLENIVGKENIKFNESMKKHSSFRCGGSAKIYVTPEKIDDLIKLIKKLNEESEEYIVIGRGSNILVNDNGIDKIVINTNKLKNISVNENVMECECGATLALICEKAKNASLTGFEFACAIPGSFGGGVFMNAGAHGSELKDVLINVTVFDGKSILNLTPEDLEMGYRTSNVYKNNYVVLSGKIVLKKGNINEITDTIEKNKLFRKKQPSEPSAGSTFKRKEGVITAKLIDEAGLKGFHIGDAYVSEKHAGFIVNKGNASSSDILNVIDKVKKEVYNKYNIEIEEEIRII